MTKHHLQYCRANGEWYTIASNVNRLRLIRWREDMIASSGIDKWKLRIVSDQVAIYSQVPFLEREASGPIAFLVLSIFIGALALALKFTMM